MRGERVLVTGGAGFIGSNLAEVFYTHYIDAKLVPIKTNAPGSNASSAIFSELAA